MVGHIVKEELYRPKEEICKTDFGKSALFKIRELIFNSERDHVLFGG
ncbi:MAG: hypothetical protein KAS63_08620 [Candidatus Heimdallarchaeota archaeon]|nr:hypothetical protein [Candidatus Heimdallarchaeota archaeon]MCK4955410.1 hypothetical protein [Candidatus Heimdallarchaeota archaeon]